MSFEGAMPVMADATAPTAKKTGLSSMDTEERAVVFDKGYGYSGGFSLEYLAEARSLSMQEAEDKAEIWVDNGFLVKQEQIFKTRKATSDTYQREVSYVLTPRAERIRLARIFRDLDPDVQNLIEFYVYANTSKVRYNQADLASQLGYSRKRTSEIIGVAVDKRLVRWYQGWGNRGYDLSANGETLAEELRKETREWKRALQS